MKFSVKFTQSDNFYAKIVLLHQLCSTIVYTQRSLAPLYLRTSWRYINAVLLLLLLLFS